MELVSNLTQFDEICYWGWRYRYSDPYQSKV